MAIGDKIYNLEINDSEFEREGWKNARYKGSKLTAAKINKFSEGDISFANQPVIEQYSKTVYVFDQASDSFEALKGIFYPAIDEFSQPLDDQRIVGSTQFKIDRAVTFTIDDPLNFSQINPGIDDNNANYNYFNDLLKTDLAIFNSCSVRYFNNVNNCFVKPHYTVGNNTGEFKPAAAYFLSASVDEGVHAGGGESQFDYGDSIDGSRLYINPNVEDWFISQVNASGSQGTIGLGTTAITIDHIGSGTDINSIEGYYFGLSSKLHQSTDNYYISFNRGSGGSGSLNEKNILKAFDIHRLEYSGSNINLSNNEFNIKTTGRGNFKFISSYTTGTAQEYILFRETKLNNIIHLDFNQAVEAPGGTGNGGIIIPQNLHPKIKESLNVYLSNAGLGAEGGSEANFTLGGITAITPKNIVSNTPSQLLLPNEGGYSYTPGGYVGPTTTFDPDNNSDIEDNLDRNTIP